jgi:hypothetical protein
LPTLSRASSPQLPSASGAGSAGTQRWVRYAREWLGHEAHQCQSGYRHRSFRANDSVPAGFDCRELFPRHGDDADPPDYPRVHRTGVNTDKVSGAVPPSIQRSIDVESN